MKKIEVLGPGCPRCEELLAHVEAAVAALGIEATIEKIAEPMEIAKRGVMFTPGLVIEGKVVCSGRLPETEEIKAWLQESSADDA